MQLLKLLIWGNFFRASQLSQKMLIVLYGLHGCAAAGAGIKNLFLEVWCDKCDRCDKEQGNRSAKKSPPTLSNPTYATSVHSARHALAPTVIDTTTPTNPLNVPSCHSVEMVDSEANA